MQKFDIRSKTSIENTYLRTSRNPEKKSDLNFSKEPPFKTKTPEDRLLTLSKIKRASEPVNTNPFAIHRKIKKNGENSENLGKTSNFIKKQCFSQKKQKRQDVSCSLSTTQPNNPKSQSELAPVLVRTNSEMESNMFGEEVLKSRLLSQQSESHSTLLKFQLGIDHKTQKQSIYVKGKPGFNNFKEQYGFSNGRSLKESLSFYTPDTKQVKNPQLEWSFNCISNAGVSFDDKSHSNSNFLCFLF